MEERLARRFAHAGGEMIAKPRHIMATLSYRPDIDGLRAVAILGVVAYHARIPGFSGGFLGVDVFFVISGFLITRLLHRELDETGRISLSGFYARRARRILPAMVAVILATALASH